MISSVLEVVIVMKLQIASLLKLLENLLKMPSLFSKLNRSVVKFRIKSAVESRLSIYGEF